MQEDKEAFKSCLVALTHGTMWSFHLTSSLDEWLAPREDCSVPRSAGVRMLLNDSSLHCSSYCFTELCSHGNSQGQFCLLVTEREKRNMWWKNQQGMEPAWPGHQPHRLAPSIISSSAPAVVPQWRSCCNRFPAAVTLPLSSLSSPLRLSTCSSPSPWTTEFGLRIAGLGVYSACRKRMLLSLFIPFGGMAGLRKMGQHHQAVPTMKQQREGIARARCKKQWC